MEDLVRNTTDTGAANDADDFFAAGAFAADLEALESKAKEKSKDSNGQKQYSSIKDASTARLQALQEKMNVGRAKAKEARESEAKAPKAGPDAAAREEIRDAKAREKHFYDSLAAQGEDPDRFWRLQQTQEAVEKRSKGEKRKRDNDTVDPNGDEKIFQSFLKRQKKTGFTREEYEAQKEKKGDAFYAGADTTVIHDDVGKGRVDLMLAEMAEQAERRKNFSRRRAFDDDEDVTYINEANRNFVKKLARAYDPYTTEIAENIERGTAL